jgi:hypothetical protein
VGRDLFVSSSIPITEYVEGEGSGYTVRVDVLDPEKAPEVKKEGYRSPTALFTILNDGAVYADHDRHEVIRAVPGSNGWLHEPLRDLEERALEANSES